MNVSGTHDGQRRNNPGVWLLSIFSVIALAAIIFVLIYSQYLHSFDSFLINMSGRERMLSQKISKELLLLESDSSLVRSIGISSHLFESTLVSLRNGGEIFSDLQLTQKRSIPAADDVPLMKQIDEALALWKRFEASADMYISTDDEKYLDEIILTNPPLLESLNSVTLILQERAEWRAFVSNIFLSVSAGLLIIMLLFFLRNRIIELKKATNMIERLETILPICANCKRIREKPNSDNVETWITIEEYISQKEATKFSHGICPECAKRLYPDLV